MRTVNVATLKEKLSHYLGLVKRGEEVIVTSHRHPVARLIPTNTPSDEIIASTRPVKDVLKIKGVPRRRSISAVDLLIADRRRR
jgi:prevent-host-death family protein